MASERVLVVGGTGQTGRLVVTKLLARGASVRVLSRSAARAAEILGDEVDVHEGDARDPESLQGLGEGIGVAVLAMGTRTYFGANGGAAVDAIGTANVVAALAARQLILLSAFGLDRASVFLTLFSVALGNYFRHKAAAEEAVRDSGVPYTIVRPVELRNRAPRAPILLNQREPLGLLRTVSREAVAQVLVASVDHPDAMGKTFEVCEGGSRDLDAQLRALDTDDHRIAPVRTPLW